MAVSGSFTLQQQMQAIAASLWPAPPPFIEDVFSTFLYTGTDANQTINNGIDLAGKGGLVWNKVRGATGNNSYHYWVDTVRGRASGIASNAADAQYTSSAGTDLSAFTSTGYTLGPRGVFNASNASGASIVSWTFRKQAKFFDIVTYTGNGVNNTRINHNLGSTPGCVIVKRTNVSENWAVWHRGSGVGNGFSAFSINSTSAASDGYPQDVVNATNVNVSDIVGASNSPNGCNVNGATYVMYLFAHNAGGFGTSGNENVISCGSFATDGSGNATVNLGYEPQWLLLKRVSATSNWAMQDTMRGWTASTATGDQTLYADLANAETSQTVDYWSPTATGFTTTGAMGSGTYIYMAIRRGPMRVPSTGTSVFSPNTYTGSGANQTFTNTVNNGGALVVIKGRNATFPNAWYDQLRGAGQALVSNSTAGEQSAPAPYEVSGFTNKGFLLGENYNLDVNNNTAPFVYWQFVRAPGFFDEVCYSGNSTAGRTVNHNLSVAPELMIVKTRNGSGENWMVYSAALGNTKYLVLNDTAGETTATNRWNNTSPTSSVFTLGTSSSVNFSTYTYVAYLFATVAGVSKVGSYTGTGTTQTINCAFTTGARFVLIKRTDASGSWYVWDSARGIVAGNDPYLLLNSTDAEVTNTDYIDTAATGFEISSTAPAAINASGGSFIFLAIA
jgi:hypothetical protein